MHALFMKHNKLAAAQSMGKRGPCGIGAMACLREEIGRIYFVSI